MFKATFIAASMMLFLHTTILAADIGGLFDAPDIRAALSQDGGEEAAMGGAPVPYEKPVNENEYIVGPGDELQVYVGKNYNLRINPESYLIFPGEPPIALDQITLAAAKNKIKDALGQHFKKSLIYVSLKQVKSIKVAVLGEVNKQGLYTVPCNTRLSELIAKSEGFARTARVPLVQVIHRDSSVAQFNLGEYYRTGNLAQNPYLNMGDRIMVPRIDPTRPKVELLLDNASYFYELTPDKRLGEIITEMSGFTKAVDLRAGRLSSGKILVGTELLEYAPKDGDVIDLLGRGLKVYVEGQVDKPFAYDYRPGSSARDYMAQAGISIASQSDGKVTVVRANGERNEVELSSIQIYPGDHLSVEMTGYSHFKDYIITVGSVATVILTAIYLFQITKSI